MTMTVSQPSYFIIFGKKIKELVYGNESTM